jgi:enoyl-CoA hydratase/carnithine racemase
MFPKILGEEIANKLLEEGAVLNAQDALRHGLVHCIVPEATIAEVVTKYCKHIATLPPDSEELTKRIKKENLLEILKEVNLKECDELEKAVVSRKCFTALAKYLESRNMKSAAFMMRCV